MNKNDYLKELKRHLKHMNKEEKEDIKSKNYFQRFLDVTKADMFFSKSLILVEGISEQLLVPEFAKILEKDLTDSHVSIVNIGGRYFEHFLKLFDVSNEYALKKKVACITDLDPQKKKKTPNSRWKNCFPFDLNSNDSEYEYKECSNDVVNKYSGREDGDFIRTYAQNGKSSTFEYDLILANPDNKELITDSVSNAGEIEKMMDIFKEGGDIDSILNEIANETFKNNNSPIIKNCTFGDQEKCKHIIAARYLNSVKKGSVAQELAYLISENHKKGNNGFEFNIPPYISEAIQWIY